MKNSQLRWSHRSTAILLMLLQPLVGWPLYTLTAETVGAGSGRSVSASANLEPNSSPKSELGQPTNFPSATTEEAPTPTVNVNRKIPTVQAPSGFKLSQNPTDEEITRCGLFSEPLVPMTSSSAGNDNVDLSAALHRYASRTTAIDASALTEFCEQHQQSRWRVGVLYNLGHIYYYQGRYSKALTAWDDAWKDGKTATDPAAVALANQTFAALGGMNGRLGRTSRLEELLQEADQRKFLGSSAQEVADLRDALALMKYDPGHSFRCGPLALAEIRRSQHITDAGDQVIRAEKSTSKGCSFVQVANLAAAAGMEYQLAKRDPGARVITPAVVHWKVGHYAALVQEKNGKYLAKDLTFQNNIWFTCETLDEEASGYFLVPKGPLPDGWHPIKPAEVADVWGCGPVNSTLPGGETTNDPPAICGGTGPSSGMASYNVKLQAVSLTVFDTPVGYHPPVGPAALFTARYHQRADGQPATFTFSNLGQNWFHDWMAYVVDDPTNPGADVNLFPRGGGYDTFTGYDSTTQFYALDLISNTTLVITSPTSYERRFADGSKEIYAQPNNVSGPGRQVFLTQIVDAQGNSLTLKYDSQFRLVSVTDAIGQVTTLRYGLKADPYKITEVTDPFGRAAKFTYTQLNGTYMLTSITDVIGITSKFAYEIGFLHALTTPYGTTSFLFSQGFGAPGDGRALDIYDPTNGHQRVEFMDGGDAFDKTLYPYSDPVVPSGMNLFNAYLYARNVYYWDQHAMEVAPYNYEQAIVYHFQHWIDTNQMSRLLEATGFPFDSRIWFNYPGQTEGDLSAGITVGSPSSVGRVLDNSGTTQLSQYSYNGLGNLTSDVDPVGRTTQYTYAPNGIDVTQVQHYNGSSYDTVRTAVYNSQHLPTQIIDAAGQTTTIQYNTFGEATTVTDPKNETTTYTYDSNGYLQKVTDALTGTQASYTYDGFGRVRTYTDVNGFTTTYSYDNLDRTTEIRYPDKTTDTYKYQAMSLVEWKDRLNHVTQYSYNSLEQLIEVIDPEGRKTQYDYCACGALTGITDGNGNTTTFVRDVEDRVMQKIYADKSVVDLNYDFSGRLSSMVDAKQQTTTYQYGVDDLLDQVTYTIQTPSVAFTYDAYARVASMTDGVGTTNYSYVPAGQLGALQLGSEVKPTGYGTITLHYDQLGRVVNQSIDGSDSRSFTYDAIGRVSNQANGLGAFTYQFVGDSTRLQSLAEPNGQTFKYQYYGATGDFRLQQMLQQSGTALASNGYTYDAVGNIRSWQQKNPTDGTGTWNLTYDADNELQKFVSQAAKTSGGLDLGQGAYTYDPGANLTKFTGKAALTELPTAQYTVNDLNQVTTVTNPASTAIAYDANGNPLNGVAPPSANPNTVTGARTYSWDGANRLSQIAYSGTGNSSSFSYDGLGRLVEIVETANGATQGDQRYVWIGDTMVQQRNTTGGLLKDYFDQGFLDETTAYYYATDQLGSIRNLTDAAGSIQTQLDYGPYGEVTELSGQTQPDFTYTGFFYHQRSGLQFAEYRAYDSGLKRWLNRDPIGETGGINLYTYVGNMPTVGTDSSGYCPTKRPPLTGPTSGHGGGKGGGQGSGKGSGQGSGKGSGQGSGKGSGQGSGKGSGQGSGQGGGQGSGQGSGEGDNGGTVVGINPFSGNPITMTPTPIGPIYTEPGPNGTTYYYGVGDSFFQPIFQ
jgi:RHS repeat-associated protein